MKTWCCQLRYFYLSVLWSILIGSSHQNILSGQRSKLILLWIIPKYKTIFFKKESCHACSKDYNYHSSWLQPQSATSEINGSSTSCLCTVFFLIIQIKEYPEAFLLSLVSVFMFFLPFLCNYASFIKFCTVTTPCERKWESISYITPTAGNVVAAPAMKQ